MAGRPRRSIHMSVSRRRPVTREKSLAGAFAVVASATRGAGCGAAVTLRVDHTVEQEVEALSQRAERERGRLDVLVDSGAGVTSAA
jgi:NAD(P)-dependent dehydrogenase (short-subunit alcohol dehydrogenase family)